MIGKERLTELKRTPATAGRASSAETNGTRGTLSPSFAALVANILLLAVE
jgi:hypothetical protein